MVDNSPVVTDSASTGIICGNRKKKLFDPFLSQPCTMGYTMVPGTCTYRSSTMPPLGHGSVSAAAVPGDGGWGVIHHLS